MTINNKRRLELEEIVQNFCSEKGVNMRDDIFKELNKIGFVVHNAKFKRPLSGMILVNEKANKLNGFGSNKIIIYNSEQTLYEIRFILAHELSHYISRKVESKGENLLFAARDHTDRYSDNVDEQEKDYMAAAMLMPRAELKQDVSDYLKKTFEQISREDVAHITKDDYFIQALQRKYRVQEALAVRRIEEICEECKGVA